MGISLGKEEQMLILKYISRGLSGSLGIYPKGQNHQELEFFLAVLFESVAVMKTGFCLFG